MPRKEGMTDWEWANYGARSYRICLVDYPKGVLFLQRADTEGYSTDVGVFFLDRKTLTVYDIFTLPNGGNEYVGFRCDAGNLYQSAAEKRFINGFGFIPNYIGMTGNNPNAETKGQINNIAISII